MAENHVSWTGLDDGSNLSYIYSWQCSFTYHTEKMMFDQEMILKHMESLRLSNGAFIASPTPDYSALWIRDHLYMTFSYFYLGADYLEKLVQGIQLVFNIFHTHRHKLERILPARDQYGKLIVYELINAKYEPMTLNEVTRDWGHHQLDMLGLFLYIVAYLDFQNITVSRDRKDREILQLIVWYLGNIRYWEEPDNGIWEECIIKRSSSIGSVVAGLKYIERQGLNVVVPTQLISLGENELHRILPYESRDNCGIPQHNHDCDAAQLFLIWPFHVLDREMTDTILSRIIKGHMTDRGIFHRLVQPHGINRYWGDGYYLSKNGISAQWQLDFLFSIIYAQLNDYENAVYWFNRGSSRITADYCITEAYTNDKPNNHTPLGWMHALALIAYLKLPNEYKKQVV